MYRATEIAGKPVVVNSDQDPVCYCTSAADATWTANKLIEVGKHLRGLPSKALWELAAQCINRAQIAGGLPETMEVTACNSEGDPFNIEMDRSGVVCQVTVRPIDVQGWIDGLTGELWSDIEARQDFDVDTAWAEHKRQALIDDAAHNARKEREK